MVQITPDEVMELKRRKPDAEELTDLDKSIIGNTCRLEIPFRDVHRMRQTAELLRNYAELLESYSYRTDMPARAILFYLRQEARFLNQRIRETRGPGRPRKD